MPIKVQGTEIVTNDRKLINLEGAAVTGIVTSLVAGTGINISGATGRVTISSTNINTTDLQQVPNVSLDLNSDGDVDSTDVFLWDSGWKTSTVSIANTTNNAGLNFFGGDVERESALLTQYSGGFSLFTQNSSNNYYDNYISAMPSNGIYVGSTKGITILKTSLNGSTGPTGCVSLSYGEYPELDIKTSVGIGATLILPNVIPDYDNNGSYDITDALSFVYGLKTPTVSIANTTNNAGLNFFGIDILTESVGSTQYSGGFSLFTQNSTYDYYDNFISAMPSSGINFGSSSSFSFTQVEVDGDGGPITGGFNMNAVFTRYPQLEINGSVGIGSTLIVANANPDLNNNGTFTLSDATVWLSGGKTYSNSIVNESGTAGINFYEEDILDKGFTLDKGTGGFTIFTAGSGGVGIGTTWAYSPAYIQGGRRRMTFGTGEEFVFNRTLGYASIDRSLVLRYCTNEDAVEIGGEDIIIPSYKVGIGTTNPVNRLQIGNGSIGFQGGNVRIGDNAGTGSNNDLTLNNIFIGASAGELSSYSTGDTYNIHIGGGAGRYSGSGGGTVRRNLFLGYYAGYGSTTGLNNIHIGVCAGACSVASGSNNISIGCDAGCAINGGNSNVFIGEGAGRYNLSGECSVAIGYGAAALGDRTGTRSILIGFTAGGYVNYDNQDNVFIGSAAGAFSGNNNPTLCNVFIGAQAGLSACGDLSIHIGYNAGCNSSGSNNIGIGYSANSQICGNCNISLGYEAGRGLDPYSSTGADNVFLGFRSGYKITSGSANISIGRLAGCGVTDGQSNIFMGQYAGCCNSTGDSNNIIGYGAGRNSTGGDSNNFFGTFAGRYNNGGNCNTFIGPFAGRDNTIGNNNIYIGPNSGVNYCDGNINIAIGNNSLSQATTGSNNIAIGSSSGSSNAASLISITNQSNRIIIGNKDHINFYTKMATTGSGGNAVCFNSTTYELYSTSSSARYKENIRPFLSGVKEILDIEPVTFTYIERPDEPEQVGFIAEQLDGVGLNHFVTYNGENQPESVTYDRVIVLAINAIKELHKENEDLKLRIVQLENIVGISSGSSQ